METKKNIVRDDKIDLVAKINSWASKSDGVHPSHLYPLDPNAVLTEVPTSNTIHHSGLVFAVVVKTILKAITAGAKLSTQKELGAIRNGITLCEDAYTNDAEITDSSKNFYAELGDLATRAIMHWYIVEASTNKGEADFKTWKSVACRYFLNETGAQIDPAEYGFVKKTNFFGIDPLEYHSRPDLWQLDDPSELQKFEPGPGELHESLEFFNENQVKLNTLYRHSVALINYVPKLELDCWFENEYNSDFEDFDLSWTRKPKTKDQSFFSRSFRYKYLGESIVLDYGKEQDPISEVEKLLKDGSDMDALLTQYLVAVDTLVKEKKSAYLESEVKDITTWFGNRSRWYRCYQKVQKWFRGQVDYIPDGEAAEAWETMKELHEKPFPDGAKISRTKLEEIKADFILSSRIEVKKPDPLQKPKSAYEEYKEVMSGLGPRLEEEGWLASLTSRNDLVHKSGSLGKFGMGKATGIDMMNIQVPSLEQQRAFAALMTTPVSELDLDEGVIDLEIIENGPVNVPQRKRGLKQGLEKYDEAWLARFKEKQEKESVNRLERISELDRLLEEYGKTSVFLGWYEVLADFHGQCTRKEIGFQRVKEKSQDAAQRNAGKRFVDSIAKPYPLEPVKHFIELGFKEALKKELRVRIEKSTKEELRADRDKILRNFDRSASDDNEVGLIRSFCELMVVLGYTNGDIDTFLRDALKDVGKKDPTNRTLYDARHVALAFCLDKTMQRKEPRHNAELAERVLNEKREINAYHRARGKHPLPFPEIEPTEPQKED